MIKSWELKGCLKALNMEVGLDNPKLLEGDLGRPHVGEDPPLGLSFGLAK